MELSDLLSRIKFEGIKTGDYDTLTSSYLLPHSDVSFDLMTSTIRGHRLAIPVGHKAMVYSQEIPITKKPADIINLEQILSITYNTKVTITGVKDLPITKKQVREVHFRKDDWLYKVWVFKADPLKTAKELTIYYIIHKQGIPTAKPIGYTPTISQQEYPYDIAILGGILEHAGDSYDELISNMELEPRFIFETALNIASMIANFQVKLTLAKDEFGKYGIFLEKASPAREIKERMLAALNINERSATNLIKACEDLYNKQSSTFVFSHGDLHTKNIVTYEGRDSTSIKKFGIIDWASIMFDNPYSDLINFWIHHERQASKVCDSYSFGFNDINKVYQREFARRGLGFSATDIDILIQSTLRHLFETYDPTRTNKNDIESKAKTHCRALFDNLRKLKTLGYEEALTIKEELKKLLKDKEYLQPILNS